MAVNLTKGGRLNLSKENPGLSKVVVGLGWDVKRYDGDADFDLDAQCFMLGSDGKCQSEDDFIYFNHLKHSTGSVELSGDNRTGGGAGDDEQVFVELTKVPENISTIRFAVTIYDAESKRQNFGQVDNAYVHITDDKGTELCRYDLDEDFSVETAVVVGELYRKDTGWAFKAVGAGFNNGLAGLATDMGLQV